MILDNENENLKVHEWIRKYTEEGEMDIVTGYFTIGAIGYLSKTVNDKIERKLISISSKSPRHQSTFSNSQIRIKF